MQASILILIASAIIFIYLLKKDKIFIFSPASIFIAYNLFYIFALIAAYYYDTNVNLSLINEKDIIEKSALAATIGLPFFLISYNKFDIKNFTYTDKTYSLKNVNLFYLIYFIIFINLILFGSNYGWHAVSRDGLLNWQTTAFAYLKYSSVVMALLAFYATKNNWLPAYAIVLSQALVMLVDGGRTTFFGYIVALTWIWFKRGGRPKLKHFALAILISFAVISARAIAMDEDFVTSIYASVQVEAFLASYTLLQTVSITKDTGYYLYGLSYLIDPIIYTIFPGGLRDEFLTFSYFFNSDVTTEKFAPMGGFYYVTESYANFGLFGAAIICIVYAYIFRKFENTSKKKEFYGIAIIAGFSSIAAKVYFSNAVKVTIAYVFFAFIIKILFIKKE